MVSSQAEQQALGEKVPHMSWIGLRRDPNAPWLWVDGCHAEEPSTYWNSGEPNNYKGKEDCVEMASSGKWNDLICAQKHHYVCEMPGNS